MYLENFNGQEIMWPLGLAKAGFRIHLNFSPPTLKGPIANGVTTENSNTAEIVGTLIIIIFT